MEKEISMKKRKFLVETFFMRVITARSGLMVKRFTDSKWKTMYVQIWKPFRIAFIGYAGWLCLLESSAGQKYIFEWKWRLIVRDNGEILYLICIEFSRIYPTLLFIWEQPWDPVDSDSTENLKATLVLSFLVLPSSLIVSFRSFDPVCFFPEFIESIWSSF